MHRQPSTYASTIGCPRPKSFLARSSSGHPYCCRAVVLKVGSPDPRGSAARCQGVREELDLFFFFFCDRAPPSATPPRRSPVRAVSQSRHRPPPKHLYTHLQGSQVSRIGRETHAFQPVHTLTRHTLYFSRKKCYPPRQQSRPAPPKCNKMLI